MMSFVSPIILSSNDEIAHLENTLSKREFQKWLKIENKKLVQKEKNEAFQKKYKKSQNKIIENRKKIEKNRTELFEIDHSVLTFKDYFYNIQEKIKQIQNKYDALNKEVNQWEKENDDMDYSIRNKKKLIISDTTLLEMEVEVYENRKEEGKRIREESSDPKWKLFLKRLDRLPDELLRIIQSYVTFETRTALLENKYQPLKLFCTLKKPMLHHLLYRIYRKYILRSKNINLKSEAMDLWENIFGTRSINDSGGGQLWVSVKDLKHMVEYLVILFKSYEEYQSCFELFSLSILLFGLLFEKK
jgi:hypothetical protein